MPRRSGPENTYKAKYPSLEDSLREARMILQTLNPGTCNGPEKLGLWGSVHKRLWEITKNSAFLDDAVRAYERGFYLRNDYYNGIKIFIEVIFHDIARLCFLENDGRLEHAQEIAKLQRDPCFP